MMSYFAIIMAICSVFSKMSDRNDAMDELKNCGMSCAYDRRMYLHARHGLVGIACNLPGRWSLCELGGYQLPEGREV